PLEQANPNDRQHFPFLHAGFDSNPLTTAILESNAMTMAVTTKDVVCSSGMPGVIAQPADKGRYPIVVILHERYGLVQPTRDLAAKCARDGFVVIAPNFCFRAPDQKALNAGDARYAFKDSEALELISDAIATVVKEGNADAAKIAVAGYCQTGRDPLVYAA